MTQTYEFFLDNRGKDSKVRKEPAFMTLFPQCILAIPLVFSLENLTALYVTEPRVCGRREDLCNHILCQLAIVISHAWRNQRLVPGAVYQNPITILMLEMVGPHLENDGFFPFNLCVFDLTPTIGLMGLSPFPENNRSLDAQKKPYSSRCLS